MATPLHDLLRSITSEPSIRSEFVADPDRFLADHGWEDLSGLDALTALGALIDESPFDEAIPLAAALGDSTDRDGAGLLAELATNLDAADPDGPGEAPETIRSDLDDIDDIDDIEGADPIHLDDAIDLDDPADLDDRVDLGEPWGDDSALPSSFGLTAEPDPGPSAAERTRDPDPSTDTDTDVDPEPWAQLTSDASDIADEPDDLDSPSLLDDTADTTGPAPSWAEEDPDHLEA